MKTKILLLHGWDWRKYPSFKPEHQWQNRQEFLDLLKMKYDVNYPSLPGFGDNEDFEKPWTLDDYSGWLKKKLERGKYDFVIGYSFGCAVITHCLYQHSVDIPAILISPAIVRKYQVGRSRLKVAARRLLDALHLVTLKNHLADAYLRFVVRNPYYLHGNRFLKATYRNIAKVNLADECSELVRRDADMTFMFGSEDTATPLDLFLLSVPSAAKHVRVIDGAGHNVAGEYPEELYERVRDEIEK